MRKLTQEEYIQNIKQVQDPKRIAEGKTPYDYSITIYDGMKNSIDAICLEIDPDTGEKHGKFTQSAEKHFRCQGCPRCYTKQMNTKKFIIKSKTANKNNGGEYDDYTKSVYEKDNIKLTITCTKIGESGEQHGDYEITPGSHTLGHRCPICGNENGTKLRTKTKEQFVKEANIVHNNFYGYSKYVYINARTEGCIDCPNTANFGKLQIHTRIVVVAVLRVIRLTGERETQKWLIEHNIKFRQQKRFKACRDILPLPFDFYLPDFNILIEFDGIQHNKYKKWYWKNKGGYKAYLRLKRHDKIKNKYCEDNGIKLIRIPYNKSIAQHLII